MNDVAHRSAATDGRIQVGAVSLAYRRFSPPSPPGPRSRPHSDEQRPVIVMLHEGLGSITQWRELPDVLARRCDLDVVAYDRSGYGRSDPAPQTYREGFIEHEAAEVLPAVLDRLGVCRPILVGHSDGASIALTAASLRATDALGIAAIAPHTFVEEICVDAIRSIGEPRQRERLLSGLARHHDHPRLALDRWRQAWLSPQFRDWDIRELMSHIGCPVLVLQGDSDQYGTEAQVSEIVRLAPNASGHVLDDCGHVAHRDQPALIADYLVDFVAQCAFLQVP